jgi:hypothetical protein
MPLDGTIKRHLVGVAGNVTVAIYYGKFMESMD